MSPSLHQLHRARILLLLAALLLIAAQFLPWERVPVEPDSFAGGGYYTAHTTLTPMHHVWSMESVESSLANYGRCITRCFAPGVIHTEPAPMEHIPTEFRVYLPVEMWTSASKVFKGPVTALATESTAAVVIWFIAAAMVPLLPVLTGLFSRARPLLWLTLFFYCSLLAWLVKVLVPAPIRDPGFSFANVGFGYWLTLVALIVEITALFLIPNAVKHHLRQPS